MLMSPCFLNFFIWGNRVHLLVEALEAPRDAIARRHREDRVAAGDQERADAALALEGPQVRDVACTLSPNLRVCELNVVLNTDFKWQILGTSLLLLSNIKTVLFLVTQHGYRQDIQSIIESGRIKELVGL